MAKKVVRARRRRRHEPSDSGDRERAATPQRERSTESRSRQRADDARPASAPGGSATQSPLGGILGLLGGGRSSGRSIVLVLALLALFACVYILFLRPQSSEEPAAQPPTAKPSALTQTKGAPSPTRTSAAVAAPGQTSQDGPTWLVMLYQDADDKVLEKDIYLDLNEAERAGSSERMHIVSQVDRYSAGYRGDGDWSTTKRFYVTLDDDLNSVYSQEVADLGEVNMADGDVLVDFVTWAIDTYPADKHVLILSDHGMGWPGGWSDANPTGRGDHDVALARAGDHLFLMEMDDALEEIRARTGLERFELIGLDACLMGHIEVYDMLAPHARYAVASQEIEPALGWAYTGFLGALRDNPSMSGADLARLIVSSYIEEDQRIVDDAARADLLSRGSPLTNLLSMPSADQIAQQMQNGVTLAAIDLQAVPALMERVNDLAYELQGTDQRPVAKARSYAQSYTSIFGKQVPPSYLDLGHLAQVLKAETNSASVAGAADAVLAALGEAVIAEKHGPQKPAASGVSIYFPNSQLYQSPYAGHDSYTTLAHRFASESLWDEFLNYHYTGASFGLETDTAAAPEPAAVVAPGAGAIQASPVTLSADRLAPGETILLSTDIEGTKIGYILLFAGYYDPESRSIYVADTDYLESDTTRDIDGVYYPVWSDGDEFTMEFEWEPIVFAIDDGEDEVPALFSPEVYGAIPEQAVYTVEGLYTHADGGESRYARLYFRDGILEQVYGYTAEEGTGAPREIIPSIGDTFTVADRWMDLDDRGAVSDTVARPGGTLTFRGETFTWDVLDAAAGQYVVGFMIQDLDGNTQQTLGVVTVE